MKNDMLEIPQFDVWWLLGRKGVFRWFGIDYKRSVYLSADYPLPFVVAGKLWTTYSNLTWRLLLLREVFRKCPRVRLL